MLRAQNFALINLLKYENSIILKPDSPSFYFPWLNYCHGQVEQMCGPGVAEPALLLRQELHLLPGLLRGLQGVLSQASGETL